MTEQFRAKKSLGQNFLTSKKIIDEILDVADITSDEIVLEVGPGKGILTEALLRFAGKVIAIEKDTRLIEPLNQTFAKEILEKKLDLIEEDVLDFDPSILSFYDLNYIVVANIPYYITGQILRKFLTTKTKPSRMILMVQKEVAERIVARDGKESLLSLSVKAYGKPRIARTVPKQYFKPTPKVDSAILVIEEINNSFFENMGENTEDIFFRILHAGFSSKRKKLLGNLANADLSNKQKLERIFFENRISPDARAEDLKMGQWRSILKSI